MLALGSSAATRSELVGAKAANLARACRAGLPTLPGMVLTTTGASVLFSTGEPPADVATALQHAWMTVSDDGRRAVVVRSSSTLEDAETSSMAGRFTSLLDVRGWDDFLAAVRTVLDSATSPELSDAPMAVLVQPHLTATRGGVLFGADPVTGNADHLVVAAVDGGPHQLVDGSVDGTTTTLTPAGRLVAGVPLPRHTRRQLADLARRTATTFGDPQDMEWAFDTDGRLWLLQSRPITTPVHHPTGPRLGPGPVAETLPGHLSPLEEDLWVDPLRTGLTEALRLSGSVPATALQRSPVVVTVGGQVAADLDLLEPPRRRGLLRRVDPRPGARRLRAAWSVGRLRAACTDLGRDLVEEVDAALLDVPPLPELSDRQLLAVLHTSRTTLTALHGHEILAGLLLGEPDSGPDRVPVITGAEVALRTLSEGRAAGLDDAAIVERDPVVLALVPPQVGPPPRLPASPGRGATNSSPGPVGLPGPAGTNPGDSGEIDQAATLREVLRVRARWVQELGAGAAWELGGRLQGTGHLADRWLVRCLTLDELGAMVTGAPAPTDLLSRAQPAEPVTLPVSFRLSAEGAVVADLATPEAARGAGGGVGRGEVHVGREPTAGSVLVVRTLDPSLASVLPGLAGLVAETGSPLSHLAILAREQGIPTVVGLAGALDGFRPGELVEVDGTTGSVTSLAPPASQTTELTSDDGVVDLTAPAGTVDRTGAGNGTPTGLATLSITTPTGGNR